MTSWLLETLLWTGALIALVLVIRRPVARWFGPQVAYALWLLPAVRLVMPAIELPAWMRIVEPAPEPAVAMAQPVSPILDAASTDAGPASTGLSAAVDLSSVSSAQTPSLAEIVPFDLATLFEATLAIWLVGAAVFLYMRFAAYFRLRDELLEGAREVGSQPLGRSKVRLFETSAIEAPLAFGVADKVIALPQGFLAQPDRLSRDLALAHELEHHQGRDLLINVLVQPLFALHWWNPLGYYGWLALRRDQEAACDARVIAAREPETREAYANLIVSTAAGPRLALAAPMACPVLGEKSIIHRLRSLNMSDTTTGRRWMGRTMLGAAVLALPMTATISYAASDDVAVVVPVPPAPPAPLVSPVAPTPPSPPVAPAAPVPPALLQSSTTIIEIDPNDEDGVSSAEERTRVIIREEERRERQMEEMEERRERAERRVEELAERQERMALRIERRYADREYGLSDAEMNEIMVDVRESMNEAYAVLDDLPAIIDGAMEAAGEGQNRVKVIKSCKNDSDEVAYTYEKSDGVTVVELCKARAYTAALEGLREARESIEENEEIKPEMRERVIRQLDAQIRRWETHTAS